MARPNLPLVLGLTLVAFCLLELSRDVRALPQERKIGGRQDLPLDDPQVKKAAQAAVASYNMNSNSLYYFRDTHIIKAESQLVAGIKYYLTMEMGSTACRKSRVPGNVDLTTCPLAAGMDEEKLHCDFEILFVPWKNSSQLLKHNCVQMK